MDEVSGLGCEALSLADWFLYWSSTVVSSAGVKRPKILGAENLALSQNIRNQTLSDSDRAPHHRRTNTYLYTYSMEQCPFWEANWFSASQEMYATCSVILWPLSGISTHSSKARVQKQKYILMHVHLGFRQCILMPEDSQNMAETCIIPY